MNRVFDSYTTPTEGGGGGGHASVPRLSLDGFRVEVLTPRGDGVLQRHRAGVRLRLEASPPPIVLDADAVSPREQGAQREMRVSHDERALGGGAVLAGCAKVRTTPANKRGEL